MKTRSITYIEEDEDLIALEVIRASKKSIEENLLEYFDTIVAQCAMMGVDVNNSSNTRKIYFIDEQE